MRKALLIFFGLVLALAGASLYLFLGAPQKIESKINSTLGNAGFHSIALGQPEKQIGKITYKDIKLDKDAFSTIEEISLTYSPLSVLFGGALENFHIKNAELTGEISPEGKITLAGWEQPNLENVGALIPKARTIQLDNAKLSLLSPELGGISISGDAQLRPSRRKATLKATLKGAQKRLNAQAKIDAQIGYDGAWNAQMEIEQGKFQTEALRAARLAGLVRISAQPKQSPQIIGELQSGGLNVLGLPWQNGAMTLSGDLFEPQMILAAKSAGFEGLELGVTFENIRTPEEFSGQIHIEAMSAALNYLESQNAPMPNRNTLKVLENLEAVNINFQAQNQLIFNINNELQNIDIKGNIIKDNDGKYTSTFSSTPSPLSTILGEKNASGTASILGNITLKENTPEGEIEIQLSDASASFGALPLSNVNGSLKINNLKTLSGPVSEPLKCSFKGLRATEECEVSLRPRNGKTQLNNLNLKIPGLHLSSAQSPRSNSKTLVTVKDVGIKELFDLFRAKNWGGTGLLSGTLSLQESEDGTAVDKLFLKNKGVGILKLTDQRLFDLMDMEELEKETMKLALENFHYDLLEIKASGTFPDQVKISVFGKGKNPLLMQGRTFSLDFEVTPDLSPVIARLISEP